MALAVATLGFVYPVVLRPASHVGSGPHSEVWGHLWAHWLMGHGLSRGESPFHASLVNCPDGMPLYPVDPLNAVITTVFRPIIGLVAAFDLMMIGLLLATMVAVYLLSLELGASRWAATGAGIIAGLGPYVRASFIDGYSEALGLFWGVLVLRSLVRQLRDPRPSRAVTIGLLFAALFYSDLYTTVATAACYVAVVLAVALRPPVARRLPWLVAAPALGLLLALPGALALRGSASPLAAPESGGSMEDVGAFHHLPPPSQCWQSAGRRAAVDLGALLPVPRLDDSCTDPLLRAVYPGFVAQLCLVALLFGGGRERRGLFLGALASLALSAGIYLTFHGHPVTIGDRALMGPLGLLARIWPPAWGLNSPFRFVSIYTVLAAAGAALVATSAGRRGTVGKAAAAGLLVACLADSLVLGHVPFPVPATDARVSGAFTWLGAEDVEGSVVEWPLPAPWDPWRCSSCQALPEQKALYHQTLHRRCLESPGPAGWTASAPGTGGPRWAGCGAETLLTELTALAADGAGRTPPAGLAGELAAAGVGFVALHSARFEEPGRTAVRSFLTDAFGEPRAFDREVEVYSVASPPP